MSVQLIQLYYAKVEQLKWAVTSLSGVPSEAWEYRLGTYSALE